MITTIIVADDHALVRRGVRALFQPIQDFSVVAEAGDGDETLRLVEQLSPDVLVVDITMPGLDGLEVTRQVQRRIPKTRVVILSMHESEIFALNALRAGAMAYVLKQAVADDLVRAVREAVAGRHYLSPPLSMQAVQDYAARIGGRPADPYDTLTRREREVLLVAATGMTYRDMAGRLGVSRHTVEAHMRAIMQKLGLRTAREVVRYAVERGLK